MKVMMIAPYFYPRIGGLENYVYNISKLLIQKYGIDVSVICSNWNRESWKGDINMLCADISKIKLELGFRPSVSL